MLSAADRLTRVRKLLSDLDGRYGNGELHTRANLGETGGLPGKLYSFIGGLGMLEPDYLGPGLAPPSSASEVLARLREIDGSAARDRLVAVVAVTPAYGLPGRHDVAEVGEAFYELAGLLGPGTRWWTNSLVGWNRVTPHTFDGVVIGVGGGVIATVLAWDDD